MFHRAKSLKFKRGAIMELVYMDGEKRKYDMSSLFNKYPEMAALRDRKLFKSGKLDPGGYGVIWNDNLDISCEEIYENGENIG